ALTAHYYPEVALRYWPDLEFRLPQIADEFDTILDCDYWRPEQKAVFQLHSPKPLRFIFCPHGQSDKGYHSRFLAPYALQESVLLYGELMKQMLQELGLWSHIPRTAMVGNFRRLYYNHHRERLLHL